MVHQMKDFLILRKGLYFGDFHSVEKCFTETDSEPVSDKIRLSSNIIDSKKTLLIFVKTVTKFDSVLNCIIGVLIGLEILYTFKVL